MSAFRLVDGFEDVWRPVALPRCKPMSVLRVGQDLDGARARLVRIVHRVPEVMVKVTGRTRDGGHLRAHLDYISRNGGLALEDRDGMPLIGRGEVAELAEDWSAVALQDLRRRPNTPLTRSIVLSMPLGADPIVVRDAARAFARTVFADRFDYVFVLHTDADHPHVHMAVRTLGEAGARLNPKKADLETWRQVFAQALRDRGVEAEATPRRARGVIRKPERTAVRRMRDRFKSGTGTLSRIDQGMLAAAARVAIRNQPTPWETAIVGRLRRVRGAYLAQARLLQGSDDPHDRMLGRQVEGFVRTMPRSETQCRALAMALRAGGERHPPGPPRRPDRER
jgi:hypothetical protein